MTVRAAARLVDIVPVSTVDYHLYVASFRVAVADDSIPESHVAANLQIGISYILRPKKADDFIRQTIADAILNGDTSLVAGSSNSFPAIGMVIDPDDIYFPMTN